MVNENVRHSKENPNSIDKSRRGIYNARSPITIDESLIGHHYAEQAITFDESLIGHHYAEQVITFDENLINKSYSEPLSRCDNLIKEKVSEKNNLSTEKAKEDVTMVSVNQDKLGVQQLSQVLELMAGKMTEEQARHFFATLQSFAEEQLIVVNYEFMPICSKRYMDKNGTILQEKEILEVQVNVLDEIKAETFMISIEPKDINALPKKIENHRGYLVSTDYQRQKAVKEFRRNLLNLNPLYIYSSSGWNNVLGQMCYLVGQYNLSENEKVETAYDFAICKSCNYTLSQIVEMAFKLGSNKAKITMLLLFSLTGVSYKLFDEAGFPIRFLLFICGETGSFKTSVSHVLYQQIKKDGNYLSRRISEDTAVSHERALVVDGTDTVLLFDDYAPPKTSKAKNISADNLESLIRYIGDGATKTRSNASLDVVRGEGVKGTAVVTGELRGEGFSSSLRCLFIQLEKGDIDASVLSFFQTNEGIWNNVIDSFVHYLAQNWLSVLNYIKRFMLEYRMKESDLKYGRTKDMAGTMLCLTYIFNMFLNSITCDETIDPNVIDELLSIIKQSENVTEEESAENTFMSTLAYLIMIGDISLIDENSFNTAKKLLNGNDFDGVIKDGCYWIDKDIAFLKVKSYLESVERGFFLTANETVKLIGGCGYLIYKKNGAGKKTYTHYLSKTARRKYIKVAMQTIDAFVEPEVDNTLSYGKKTVNGAIY